MNKLLIFMFFLMNYFWAHPLEGQWINNENTIIEIDLVNPDNTFDGFYYYHSQSKTEIVHGSVGDECKGVYSVGWVLNEKFMVWNGILNPDSNIILAFSLEIGEQNNASFSKDLFKRY